MLSVSLDYADKMGLVYNLEAFYYAIFRNTTGNEALIKYGLLTAREIDSDAIKGMKHMHFIQQKPFKTIARKYNISTSTAYRKVMDRGGRGGSKKLGGGAFAQGR